MSSSVSIKLLKGVYRRVVRPEYKTTHLKQGWGKGSSCIKPPRARSHYCVQANSTTVISGILTACRHVAKGPRGPGQACTPTAQLPLTLSFHAPIHSGALLCLVWMSLPRSLNQAAAPTPTLERPGHCFCSRGDTGKDTNGPGYSPEDLPQRLLGR